MAVLQKLRGWGIILSILVALPLLLFIIDPSQVITALQSMSSKYDVGEIGGKSISYENFSKEVDKMAHLSEMMTGSSSSSEQQQKQIRDAVWQSMLDKYLFIPTAQAAGINVGKDEMLDLLYGDNVSPVISNSPVFMDENGAFSRDAVVDFVRNVESDDTGNLKAYWEYIQNAVYTNQYYTKYNNLFVASDTDNALVTARKIDDNNVLTDVDFVMVPFSFAKDSTVVVDSKEILNYYKAHKKNYRQVASRDIEYVVYQVVPSKEDKEAAAEEFASLHEEFATTANVKAFLQKNSDRNYTDYFYKDGELASVNADVDAFVSSNNSGTSPVIEDGDNYFSARILETAMVPDSVYVRHILLRGDNAEHLADSLLGVLGKGGKFDELAEAYSDDKNSAYDGEMGTLGWMTQSVMIPGFESVMTARTRAPYIVDTQYGKHIVEVVRTTKPVLKKKVAIYEKQTVASNETFNKFYNQANKFATLASPGVEAYRAAVDSMAHMPDAVAGTYSHPMKVYESTDTYGTISHAKELTRWAFDNKPGKVSNIITVDNKYFFIAVITGANKEGYTPVKDVALSIENKLYADKMGAKKAADIAAEIEGLTDLEAIAEKLGTSISHEEGVTFASMTSRALDPKFIGALSVAPVGEIAGPVPGNYGVYVFKVTGRDTGAFYTEDDAKATKARMQSYNAQMILPVMMEAADVKDNRARFY